MTLADITVDLGQKERCPYCGGSHPGRICPRIVELEFYSDGEIKRVHLVPPDVIEDFEPDETLAQIEWR